MSLRDLIDSRHAEAELTVRGAISEAMLGGHTRSPTVRVARKVTDDGRLMSEMVAGSVAAFGAIYDRYCDRAYRVALSVCRDDGLAQDAVQDGFISVWNSRSTYRGDQGSVAAWLLTVVRHRAIDIFRNESRHSSRRAGDEQLEVRSQLKEPAETVIGRDEARRLRESLATLPDAQAEVITLAYYGQLSHTEIAAQLGLPPGTVKGRMRLGLQKLRADIDRSPRDAGEVFG
jgi:RNA polymerase sigma-70 factor (ECF subfamily)